MAKSSQPPENEPLPLPVVKKDFATAKATLVKAIQHLMAEEDVDGVLKAKIRPMMVRLDPEFDPGNYNFSTFNAFLVACTDVIKTEKGDHDILISLLPNSSNDQRVKASKANNGQNNKPKI